MAKELDLTKVEQPPVIPQLTVQIQPPQGIIVLVPMGGAVLQIPIPADHLKQIFAAYTKKALELQQNALMAQKVMRKKGPN